MMNKLLVASALSLTMTAPALAADTSVQQQAQKNGETEVIVDQAPAEVGVDQPSPDVTVIDPEPKVKVETPTPEVTVNQPEPDVEIDQAKPDVEISRTGNADVTIKETSTQQAQSSASAEDMDRDQQQAAADTTNTTTTTTTTTGRDTTWIDNEEVISLADAQESGQVMPAEASELIGADVYGPTGDQVGEISDLIVGKEDKINRAVIEVGGFLGLGEKDVALPFDQIGMRATQGYSDEPMFLVNQTEEQLENLQEYEEDFATNESWLGVSEQERQQVWEQRIDRWGERIEQSGREVAQSEPVRDAWTGVQQTWNEAENATGRAWQEASGDLDQAMNELQQAWSQATNQQVAETPDNQGQSQ